MAYLDAALTFYVGRFTSFQGGHYSVCTTLIMNRVLDPLKNLLRNVSSECIDRSTTYELCE